MAADRTFRAMGTTVAVIVTGDRADRLADVAVDRIVDLERRWSRFRPDSEVSRLNAALGEPMSVSTETALLVDRAIDAWRITDGLVDCTLLTQLVDAGYDRSFELLAPDRPSSGTALRPLFDAGDIVMTERTVRLPPGVGFDPGGIGKGVAADLVSDELMAAGAAGVCISIGGDLRVRGHGPTTDHWTLAVEHPHQTSPIALVGVADGALATSTTRLRRWRVGGAERHHLIDPRTGDPATSDLETATAIAGQGWRAEALAKAVLLAGRRAGLARVDRAGAAAIVTGVDRTTARSTRFADFAGRASNEPKVTS